MAETVYVLLVLVPLLLAFLYAEARRRRYRYSHIPQLPISLIWGHLRLLGEAFRKHDPRCNADYVLVDLLNAAGRPPVMLLDLRPVNFVMCVVSSHAVAEQISKITKAFPYSVPKSMTMKHLTPVIGPHSIVIAGGEKWKNLRKRFNTGFAPQHLVTLLPQILDMTDRFISRLDALATSGEEFTMDTYTTSLTFDIIGSVVMNTKFNAQGGGSEASDIVTSFSELLETYSDNPRLRQSLNYPLKYKRWRLVRRMESSIHQEVKKKFADLKANRDKMSKDRSVLALALKDIDQLTPELLHITADQIKSFLFAGHDTTSILLQWLFYALSIHPKALAALRAELDEVFGDKEPREVFRAHPDETLKALTYTSACIKEALRLWPPGGSARRTPKGTGLTVRLEDGTELNVDGMVLYLCHYAIQRDPAVYGDTADDFIPERWLGNTDTSEATNTELKAGEKGIPSSSWRPFERGPRNCIGQELANIEARVILACSVPRYDFVKVGQGQLKLNEKGQPTLNAKGVYETESELFQTRQITSKPVDHCRMRIKFH